MKYLSIEPFPFPYGATFAQCMAYPAFSENDRMLLCEMLGDAAPAEMKVARKDTDSRVIYDAVGDRQLKAKSGGRGPEKSPKVGDGAMDRYEKHKHRNRISMRRVRKREKEKLAFYHRLIQELETRVDNCMHGMDFEKIDTKAMRRDLTNAAQIQIRANPTWKMNQHYRGLVRETALFRKERNALREKTKVLTNGIRLLQDVARQSDLPKAKSATPVIAINEAELYLKSLSKDYIVQLIESSYTRIQTFNRAGSVSPFSCHDRPEGAIYEWDRIVGSLQGDSSKFLFRKFFPELLVKQIHEDCLWKILQENALVWPIRAQSQKIRLVRKVDEDTMLFLGSESNEPIALLLFRIYDGDDRVYGLRSIDARYFNCADDSDHASSYSSAILFAYTVSKVDAGCSAVHQPRSEYIVKVCGQCTASDRITARDVLYQAFPSILEFEKHFAT